MVEVLQPGEAVIIYSGIDRSGVYFYEGSPNREHTEGSIVGNSFPYKPCSRGNSLFEMREC